MLHTYFFHSFPRCFHRLDLFQSFHFWYYFGYWLILELISWLFLQFLIFFHYLNDQRVIQVLINYIIKWISGQFLFCRFWSFLFLLSQNTIFSSFLCSFDRILHKYFTLISLFDLRYISFQL